MGISIPAAFRVRRDSCVSIPAGRVSLGTQDNSGRFGTLGDIPDANPGATHDCAVAA